MDYENALQIVEIITAEMTENISAEFKEKAKPILEDAANRLKGIELTQDETEDEKVGSDFIVDVVGRLL